MKNLFFSEPHPFELQYRDNINPTIIKNMYQEIFTVDTYAIPQCRVEPGDTVVDVGAYLGMFTISAIFKGAVRIIAFEPNPLIVPFLQTNVNRVLENWKSRVAFQNFQIALWDSDHLEKGNRLNYRKSGEVIS